MQLFILANTTVSLSCDQPRYALLVNASVSGGVVTQ